jgi:hypothetical protein
MCVKKFFLAVMVVVMLFMSIEAMAICRVDFYNKTPNFWITFEVEGEGMTNPVMPNGFISTTTTNAPHVLKAYVNGQLVRTKGVDLTNSTEYEWTIFLKKSE